MHRGRRARTRAEAIDAFAGGFEVNESGCWIWQRTLNNGGYSISRWKRSNGDRFVLGHRLVLALIGDPAPSDKVVDHLCRTRSCVNPDHLEVVTHSHNSRRSPIAVGGINGAKTHCVNGHEFNEANTYRRYRSDRIGQERMCRTCQRDYKKKSRGAA